MTSVKLDTHFIESTSGRLHVTSWASEGCTQAVVFVPPFAEEMNKSRRQIAMAAKALAACGFAAVLPDLYGTGDSEGEFHEATWESWVADIESVFRWVESEGRQADTVIATRFGCLLACASLHAASRSVKRTIFWQPVNSGYRHISRLLRVAVAASLMRAGPRLTIEGLREVLAGGARVDVGGYVLSPQLARRIDEQSLTRLADARLGRLHILYLTRSQGRSEQSEDTRIDDLAKEIGIRARVLRLQGAPFWTSSEIVTNEDLVDMTIQLLADS